MGAGGPGPAGRAGTSRALRARASPGRGLAVSAFARAEPQGASWPTPITFPGCSRLGIIASRKVGGAVQRNRAKRRLRK
jgi:ribonuclease P protein component